MAVTISFQPTGTVPANAGPVLMQGNSLTIGRGQANDLVLPDPERMLSKSHCVIEDQAGTVVVVDLSTNGTYLNYGKIPLGPVPTPLNNGDVLTLGAFELVVAISQGQPNPARPDLLPDPLADPMPHPSQIADPLAAPQVSHGLADRAHDPLDLLDAPGPEGDPLDDLLGTNSVPTGPSQITPVDPIDALLGPDEASDPDPFFDVPDDGRSGEGASLGMHGSAVQDSMAPVQASRSLIPDDWDDLLEPDAPHPAPTAPPLVKSEPAPLAPDFDQAPPPVDPHLIPPVTASDFVPDPVSAPKPAPQPDAAQAYDPALEPNEPPASSSDQDAARAFLAALGADDLNIADDDLVETMERAGAIMRVLVAGIRDILMTRTSIKSEFRIEQTMIGAAGNNPLKFSVSPDQAIEALLRPRMRGYLPPQDAAREALDDIAAHEVAMVAGMETAIKTVLAKLSPEELSAQIESSGRLSGLLRGRKAQYWDVYEKMFAQIADQAENDFHHFFSREFARAYQDQLNRLKDT